VARDFAKHRRRPGPPGKKAPGPRRAQNRPAGSQGNPAGPAWRAYFAGVLTGGVLSFLVYLTTLPPEHAGPAETAAPEVAATPPKPRFDFYKLLPEQTIEVDVDVDAAPAEVAQPRAATAPGELYLLQAGSFRQREDADRRRAELLLLGLEPRVEETTGDNGRWFRVYLGPFEARSQVARARSLTAAQDIDTLLLKRGSP
jgi:cell division septation protein DedD